MTLRSRAAILIATHHPVTDNVQQRGPVKLLDALLGCFSFAQQPRMGKPALHVVRFGFGVFEAFEAVRPESAGERALMPPSAPAPGLTATTIEFTPGLARVSGAARSRPAET